MIYILRIWRGVWVVKSEMKFEDPYMGVSGRLYHFEGSKNVEVSISDVKNDHDLERRFYS